MFVELPPKQSSYLKREGRRQKKQNKTGAALMMESAEKALILTCSFIFIFIFFVFHPAAKVW